MLCSPVGAYVGGALDAVDVVIARNYDRAAANGSGAFKVGGNYACSLYSLNKAHELGYKAVLYLDPATKTHIDEFNSSNFFAIKGNKYITPKSDSILPSITNMSLETVAAHLGMEVERRPVPVEELATFEEVGECGTAVVITPISSITIGGKNSTPALIGGGHFAMIAGPCSVESEEQIIEVACAVKASGANLLRGGAFKPRTSPYAFQGMKGEGIQLLLKAKEATGLPIVTEIMNISTLDLFADVDIIQVGARNMQNFDLLKELGKTKKPVLLKRGLANTLQELLMSAEYIMSEGNENVILCERGIRSFDSQYTRNVLDLSAVPVLKELTHLPVIVDPSHATGVARLVKPMALAATAGGAHGLMIEVHNNPSKALCDGPQSLTPEAFGDVISAVRKVREVL